MIADWGKLGLLAFIVLVTAVLGAIHVLDGAATMGVLLIILGYLTGNGVLARSKSAPSPVLAPRTLDADHES